MPKPVKTPKPRYNTIHSDFAPIKGEREGADYFLLASINQKYRKKGHITYWQLFRTNNKTVTDDSIQTILLDNNPVGIIPRIRDDSNYEFKNYFVPFKQLNHKNAEKILDGIKQKIIFAHPNLTERNFEIKSYDIKEYNAATGNRAYVLVVNKPHAQATVLLFENVFGTTIFRRV